MDQIKVLKRAWHILWNYRALWIFGIILALVTASGTTGPSGNTGGGRGPEFQYEADGEEIPWPDFPRPDDWPEDVPFPPFDEGFQLEDIPQEVWTGVIVVGVTLFSLVLLWIVVATIARYVTETALIRMVDEFEETGEKLTVRQGFRRGWSRAAWRLFLIDLLFFVVGVAAVLLPLLLVAGVVIGAVYLIDAQINLVLGILGIVVGIGVFFLWLFLFITVAIVVGVLKLFFRRACALEDLDAIDGIREGFGLVARHWQDVLVMWLIMIGVNIGWALLMVVGFILWIPATIIAILLGIVVGGVPALLVFGLTSLIFGPIIAAILAGIIFLPLFAIVAGLPLLFLQGLFEVFKSAVWTLAYRELRSLEALEPPLDVLPEPEKEEALDDGETFEEPEVPSGG